MRQTTSLCTAALLAAAPAPGQPALYSNGSPVPSVPALATGATSASGVAAPAGFVWSELQAQAGAGCNMIAGVSGHPLSPGEGAPYRFADDFTVGAPGIGWDVYKIVLYAYQTGAPASPPPFTAVTLRIWDADPSLPGAQVIFGDTTTNRLVSIAPTNIYRILNSAAPPVGGAPDTARLVWRLEADAPVHLARGTYWLDWQITPADGDAEASVPSVTIPGARTAAAAGATARQLRPADPAQWLPITDAGKPITSPDVPLNLPFTVLGFAACSGDWSGDGVVTSTDIALFLTAWLGSLQNGTLIGDFNADGAVNSTDISAFLTAWLDAVQSGC